MCFVDSYDGEWFVVKCGQDESNTSKPESWFLCWKMVQGSKFREFKFLGIFTSYSQVTRRWSVRCTGRLLRCQQ